MSLIEDALSKPKPAEKKDSPKADALSTESSTLCMATVSDKAPGKKCDTTDVAAADKPVVAKADTEIKKPAEKPAVDPLASSSRLLTNTVIAKADIAKPKEAAAAAPKPDANKVDPLAHDNILLAQGPAKPKPEQPKMSTQAALLQAEATREYEAKQSKSGFERLVGGYTDGLIGQGMGLVEGFVTGKRNTFDELQATRTGVKTGNESAVFNFTKTTIGIGQVVTNLSADGLDATLGTNLGDGKTSKAIGQAINKGINDYQTGTLGDKMETWGQAGSFLTTLLPGAGASGYGSLKGAKDLRGLGLVAKAEREMAVVGEAVNGVKVARALESAVPAIVTKTAPVAEGLAVKTVPVVEGLAAKTAPTVEALAAKTAPTVEGLAAKTVPVVEQAAAKTATTAPISMGQTIGSIRKTVSGWVERAKTGIESSLDDLIPQPKLALEGVPGTGGSSFFRATTPRTATRLEGTAGRLEGTGSKLEGTIAGVTEKSPIGKLGPLGKRPGPGSVDADDLRRVAANAEKTGGKVETVVADTKGATGTVVKEAEHAPTGVVARVEQKGAGTAGTVTEAEAAGGKVIKDAPVKPGTVVDDAKAVKPGTGEVVKPTGTGEVVKPTGAGEVVKPTGVGEVTKPVVGQIDNAGATVAKTGDQVGTRLAPEVGQMTVQATERVQTSVVKLEEKVGTIAKTAGTDVQQELTTLQSSVKKLVGSTDDATNAAARADIAKSLEKLEGTLGKNAVDDLANTTREIETAVGASRRVTGIEQAAKQVGQHGTELATEAERVAQTLTGKAGTEVAQTELREVARLSRNLTGGADDATILKDINRRLATVEEKGGQELTQSLKPLAQKTEGSVAEVDRLKELNRVAVQAEKEIGTTAVREVTDVAAAVKPGQTIAKPGEGAVVPKAGEVVEVAPAGIKPSSLIDEAANLTAQTTRRVESSAKKVEGHLDDLTKKVTTAEARNEITAIENGVKKLVSGTDDAAAKAEINTALTKLEKVAGKEVAEDVAALTRETRELQTATDVARRATNIEKAVTQLTENGTTIGREVEQLTAKLEPKVASAVKSDLDEIANLGKTLGKTTDDAQVVRQISDRVARVEEAVGKDAARTLRQSVEKAEGTVGEVTNLRTANKIATDVEQMAAKTNILDDVAKVGPRTTDEISQVAAQTTRRVEEGAGKVEQRINSLTKEVGDNPTLQQELSNLSRSTKDLVKGADDLSATTRINRTIENIEKMAAEGKAPADVAKLIDETRQLQRTVSASRRITEIEGVTARVVRESEEIGTKVTQVAEQLGTKPGANVTKELDEIASLSKQIGKTGDDLNVVKQITQKIDDVAAKTGDDVVKELRVATQTVENSVMDANRLRQMDRAAAIVEEQAATIKAAVKVATRDLESVATTEGRVLKQQLDAIGRTADELATSTNPAQQSTRLKQMVAAVETKAPGVADTLKPAVNALDNATTEITALKTMANQGRRIEGAVATIEQDLAALRKIAPATDAAAVRATSVPVVNAETKVATAVADIEKALVKAPKPGSTTAAVDTQAIVKAAGELERAGHPEAAARIVRAAQEIEQANIIRAVEQAAQHQILRPGLKDTAINTTIARVEQNLGALHSGRLADKVPAINNLTEDLQMLRYLARGDAKTLQLVDEAQNALSRMRMMANVAGSSEVMAAGTKELLKLAATGDQRALDKLFVNGLKSNGQAVRELTGATTDGVMGVLNRMYAGTKPWLKLTVNPDTYSVLGRFLVRELKWSPLTAVGATALYANYKYYGGMALTAINRELNQIEAEAQQSIDAAKAAGAADASQPAIKGAGAVEPAGQELKRTTNGGNEKAGEVRKADLDFTPSVAAVMKRRQDIVSRSGATAQTQGVDLDDPQYSLIANSYQNFGKKLFWSQLGYAAPAIEAVQQIVFNTARSLTIKSTTGTASDGPNRPKPASTTKEFSFSKAMMLNDPLRLYNSVNDAHRQTGFRSAAKQGGSVSSSAMTTNLRLAGLNSYRADGFSHTHTDQHRESTEDTGLDQGSGSGAAVVSGPQINIAQVVPMPGVGTAPVVDKEEERKPTLADQIISQYIQDRSKEIV